jgi:hyperosmotically inducible protein
MKSILMVAALLVGAGMAGAADKQIAANPQPGAALANSVRHEVAMYARYTIFDDVYVAVDEGTVHLTGVVSQPFKKDDIGRLAAKVAGAGHVQNDIRVLPLSPDDDRLRQRIARAVYGDPAMTRYAMEPLKAIHIVVENGHVTLAGIVATDFDKQIAGLRAARVGLSFGPIVNNLQVEHPSKKS